MNKKYNVLFIILAFLFGFSGSTMTANASPHTLFDVYKAVNVVQEKELFSIHESSHPDCLVGRNIQNTIEPLFTAAQLAMEKVLRNVTLEDVVRDISTKGNIC